MRALSFLLVSSLVACSGDTTEKDATDTTDVAETDDTGTGAQDVTATGEWVGNCSGDFSTTSSGYTYTGSLDADSTLDLTDTDGEITGQWLYTLNYTTTTTTYSSGYLVTGTRDGAHLVLDVQETTTSTAGGLSFDLTIDGDTATGDLVIEQYEVEHRLACTLSR